MERRYCPYCMTVLGTEEVCPACGRRPAEYLPAPAYLRPGTVLEGKYVLGGVIHDDEASITYIGRDLLLQKRVSVKEFFPSGQADRDADQSAEVRARMTDINGAIGAFERGRSNFEREARILAKMEKQSAVVDVQDLFEANGTFYLVTEHVTGSTLRQRVKASGPMAPGKLLPLLENVFIALKALHEKGLYHRDITPDNIILERDNARLINFASARETGGKQTYTLSTTTHPGFSALEQYFSDEQGPWTDVYGLSATIYFCLTGRTPPAAPDRQEDDPLIPMGELDVPMSRVQSQAVTIGMRVQRQDRFKSISELYDGIYRGVMPKPYLDEDDDVIIPPKPDPDPPKRRGWIAALAVMGAVAIVVAALFATGVLPPEKAAPTAQLTAAAEPTARPTATPSPTAAPGSGEAPDLTVFAGAQTLSAGEYDAQTILDLMADETVPAIVLREGAAASMCGRDFVVTKPLWVESGALLGVSSMQIPEGGLLVLDGDLDCPGVIELSGSGVRMAVSHPLTDRNAAEMTVLMEDGRNLSMDESFIDESLQNCLFIKPPLTKNIPKAADAGSLAEAVQNGGSVLLTGDVTLQETLVLENATLFVAEDAEITAELGKQTTVQITVGEGGALVNMGTVWINMDVAGGVVYNYGVMYDLQGATLSDHGTLINDASLEIRQGALYETARLVNRGDMNCCGLNVLGGRLVNAGALELSSKNWGVNLDVRYGGTVYNGGTMNVTKGSYVSNTGWIVNDGDLWLEKGAMLESLCAVYNRRSGLLRPAPETLFCIGGAFLNAGRIEATEGDDGPTQLRAELYRVPEAVVVHNGEELLAALNGEAPVYLQGDAALDQALMLTGQLYVDGGTLSAPAVTVSGGLLVLRDSGIDTGDLTIQDTAEMTVLGEQSTLNFTGALRMQEGTLYCPDSDLDLSGKTVDIQDGSVVIMERGALTADGAQITIGVAALLPPYRTGFSARDLTLSLDIGDITCPTSLALTNASITIANGAGIVVSGRTCGLQDCAVTTTAGGNLAIDGARVSLTGGTEIVNNDGYVSIGAGVGPYSDAGMTVDDTVHIVNNGNMYLGDADVPVEGTPPDRD